MDVTAGSRQDAVAHGCLQALQQFGLLDTPLGRWLALTREFRWLSGHLAAEQRRACGKASAAVRTGAASPPPSECSPTKKVRRQ